MKRLICLFLFMTNLFPLSLEEKVGQLLIVYFDGEEYNEEANRFIHELNVGGFIYYAWANGLSSKDLTAKLSHDLQNNSHVPLFISIDQEGGVVSRQKEIFPLPGNGALGFIDDLDLTYQSAKQIAIELKALGINMNFAPVVDTNGSVIGHRSFGANPNLIARHASVFIKAHLDIGVLPALKHFPGHGDTDLDSHYDLPRAKTIALRPYEIDSPAIMSAHILTDLDPNRCATTSPRIIKELLREKMGYKGLVISDSLTMQGVLKECGSLANAAVAAVAAGCDMIIIGGKALNEKTQSETSFDAVKTVYDALLLAAKEGRIDIDASVDRILERKKDLNPHLSREIALRSCYLAKGKLPDLSGKTLLVAPPHLEKVVKESGLDTLTTDVHFSTKPIPSGYDHYIAVYYKGETPEKTFHIGRDFVTFGPTSTSLRVAKEWLSRSSAFISPLDPEAIGERIWKNECSKRSDQLTFWNKNEPFPSMGIGHFIWPAEVYDGPFKEGRFNDFLTFLKSKNIDHDLPSFCPHQTRKAFYSADLTIIRALLEKTIPLQVEYMTKKLNKALISIIEEAKEEIRPHIMRQFFRLKNHPYILIDYLNFKHEGTAQSERYKNEGWGLMQVLSRMKEGDDPVDDFILAAKHQLDIRIQNNPSDKRWQKGWHSRLMTYKK